MQLPSHQEVTALSCYQIPLENHSTLIQQTVNKRCKNGFTMGRNSHLPHCRQINCSIRLKLFVFRAVAVSDKFSGWKTEILEYKLVQIVLWYFSYIPALHTESLSSDSQRSSRPPGNSTLFIWRKHWGKMRTSFSNQIFFCWCLSVQTGWGNPSQGLRSFLWPQLRQHCHLEHRSWKVFESKDEVLKTMKRSLI